MKKLILIIFILLAGCTQDSTNNDKPIETVSNIVTTRITSTSQTTTQTTTIENENSPKEYRKCKISSNESDYVIAYDRNIDDYYFYDIAVSHIILKNTCFEEPNLPDVFELNNDYTDYNVSNKERHKKGKHAGMYQLLFDFQQVSVNVPITIIFYDDIKELNEYSSLKPENIISQELYESLKQQEQEKFASKGLTTPKPNIYFH